VEGGQLVRFTQNFPRGMASALPYLVKVNVMYNSKTFHFNINKFKTL